MTKRRVTSREVAERAGVSRTTVSFVLNDVQGFQISEATRQRVLQAANDLGYVPDATARSLASGRTYILGLIFCQPADHILVDAYLPQVIYGLGQVSRERGFRVLIEAIEDVGQPDTYTELVQAKRIDGILLSGPRSDDQQLSDLIANGFPIVLLGWLDIPSAHSVDIDNRAAAAEAVNHLIKLGHERIACIVNAPAQYTSATQRLQGYYKALAAAGLPYNEALVRYGDFDPESGYQAMSSLLKMASPPTAVFVASDVVAFGAMTAIRDAGYNIPDDVAMVGFDDVPMARYIAPALTTVHLQAVEQGRRGGEMLIDLINGAELPETQVFLKTELVIRQSCGARTTQAWLC